jgi:hypothetical protein
MADHQQIVSTSSGKHVSTSAKSVSILPSIQTSNTSSSSSLMEIRLEHLERRPHIATFVKVELVLQFMPGMNKHGAIVKSFINAIHHHDVCVQKVEDIWRRVDGTLNLFNSLLHCIYNRISYAHSPLHFHTTTSTAICIE